MNSSNVNSDQSNAGSDEIKQFCQEKFAAHIQEFDYLIKECEKDATEASELKRNTRFWYFTLGIIVSLLGVTTTALSSATMQAEAKAYLSLRKDLNLASYVVGVASSVVGVGVTILSKDFDYKKSRQRAIDLRELKNELQSSQEELNLEYLKLKNNQASSEDFASFISKTNIQKKQLSKKAYELGVSV
jgi:hypothetical protein